MTKLAERKPKNWAEWRSIIGLIIYSVRTLGFKLTRVRWLLRWSSEHLLTFPGKRVQPWSSAEAEYQSAKSLVIKRAWRKVIYEHADAEIVCDACGGESPGWGCIMRIGNCVRASKGKFRTHLPIHLLEMRAITIALRKWGKLLPKRKHITVWCDNLAVVHVMRGGHAHDKTFGDELHHLSTIEERLRVSLVAQYVPSELNPADGPVPGNGLRRPTVW